MSSQFAANLNKLCERAKEKAEVVVRKTALELQSGMIEMSPVKSGRFKSNWTCGVGAVNTDTSAAPGADAEGRTRTVLEGWKPGQTIWLTNSLVYARRLENGWSKQSPNGMVRLTVQAYAQALKTAVESIK